MKLEIDSPPPTGSSAAALYPVPLSDDVFDWDNHLPLPPKRPSSSVRVRLVDCGRDKPIPE